MENPRKSPFIERRIEAGQEAELIDSLVNARELADELLPEGLTKRNAIQKIKTVENQLQKAFARKHQPKTQA